MTAIKTAIGWLTRAIKWIDNIINQIEYKQMKLRFQYESASVQLMLGTDLPDSDRANKHYAKLELDFMSQWAGRMPDIDIAMTLGRPVEGVKRKVKRIEKEESLDFIKVPYPGETENFETIPSNHETEDDQE